MKNRLKYVTFLRFFLLPVTLLFTISITSVAQAKTVTGTVKDEKGQPLSGVSVVVKETNAGTSTNTAGQFTLSAPEKGTLVFSYVGYASVEIPIGSSSTYDVSLKSGSAALGEVIVVAYGSTTKKNNHRCDSNSQYQRIAGYPYSADYSKIAG